MSVSPFFRVIGFTVEPDAHNITQRKGRREASLVVLPSDEAQWDLKFSEQVVCQPLVRKTLDFH
jgi:hypothetical protein